MANQKQNQTAKPKHKDAPMSNSQWSKTDDQRLIQLAREGSTTGKIASELGRTRSSIWARKYKLGLKDVRLRQSRGTSVPTSVGTRTRKNQSIAEVSEVRVLQEPKRQPRKIDSSEVTLENAALIAKKHGLTVTFITFHSK
jgi:hypothetical protein